MIFYISDAQFSEIIKNPRFSLPVRWDGKDFETAIANLLNAYTGELDYLIIKDDKHQGHGSISIDINEIKTVSTLLQQCVKKYHQGFPAIALNFLEQVMAHLIKSPLKVYQKSGDLDPLEKDKLYLFRLRQVYDTVKYARKDLFHVPSCTRSIISTCRYSIAGYPSLYLTTSIDLGMEEIGNPINNDILVSRFKVIRLQQDLNIRVLELGIKPQDFNEQDRTHVHNNRSTRNLTGIDLQSQEIRSNYLLWYPLLAACSFIRANKHSPFSSEYIIPQLLMQWVRGKMRENELMGIRYFSCASVRASDLGFDYVFPVNNTKYGEGYCSILRDSFLLTNPVFLKDFDSVDQCEKFLIDCTDLEKI